MEAKSVTAIKKENGDVEFITRYEALRVETKRGTRAQLLVERASLVNEIAKLDALLVEYDKAEAKIVKEI